MISLHLLLAVVAVALSSVESAQTVKADKRLVGDLIGGLLGGGGDGGGGGLLGDLLGEGLLGGLLGDNGLLGNRLGGDKPSGDRDGGDGLLDDLLCFFGKLLFGVSKLIGGLSKALSGAKTEVEKTSIFDKCPLKLLCPICPHLPDAGQVQGCNDYCAAKNYKAQR